MNLLLVNWQDIRNPQAGGAEIHLWELFSRLAKRGHRIRMVCSGFEGAPPVEEIDGIEVNRHGTRMSFALKGRRAIRAALRIEQPDVLVDDINKLPLYTPTLTDRPVYALIPHLFGTTAFQEVSWPMASAVWCAERLIPHLYRKSWFHAISESTRDDLIARGIPRQQIAVVHPGVDSSHFVPAKDPMRASPPRFVYVGRLKRYKGVDILIRALQVVTEERSDVTLDIAGSGDDRPRLERLAASLGLADSVRFLGFVDEATKISLLREAVANVFPSPKEGWGITVMEAAACGTPSLASNSPGLRDSVRDQQTGLLVSHGDPVALATGMKRLLDNPALVDKLGQAARVHAQDHSWEMAVDSVELHLQEIAAGSPSPSSFGT